MAFGITRAELEEWKKQVIEGEIAILTHFWLDDRFPGCHSVTKVGCNNRDKLMKWGKQYNLQPEWIHEHDTYLHFDLFGNKQIEVLQGENKKEHIRRFKLKKGM